MNTRSLVIASALAVIAAGSLAQEVSIDRGIDAGVAKRRAEVRIELQLARQDGTIRAWSDGYIESPTAPTTRAEVVAATLFARDSGELAAINAEVYPAQRMAVLRLAGAQR